MKDAGIEFVMYIGPYQNTEKLQSAMQQQGFEPKVYLQDATIYDERFVEESGDTADGSFVYTTTQLYDDVAIKEMALYRAWLEQVKPGAEPTTFGLFSWSATRLFVEKAIALGGKLNRASMVEAVRGERSWDANGLHTAMNVGGKTTYRCVDVVQLSGGAWRKVSGSNYLCGSLVRTSVAK